MYGAISLAKRRPSRLTRMVQGGTPNSRSLVNPGVTRSSPRLWPPSVAPTCSPSTIPSPIAFGPEIAQTPSPCSCASGQYFSMNSLLCPNPPEAITTAPAAHLLVAGRHPHDLAVLLDQLVRARHQGHVHPALDALGIQHPHHRQPLALGRVAPRHGVDPGDVDPLRLVLDSQAAQPLERGRRACRSRCAPPPAPRSTG